MVITLLDSLASQVMTSYPLTVWDPRDLSIPPKFTKPDRDVEFVAAQALKAGKILVFARTKWTGALAGCGEGKSIGSTKTYLSKIFVTDTEFSGFSEPFAGNNNSRDMSEYETNLRGNARDG